MGCIDTVCQDEIATLTLNNPDKLNAIDLAMWQGLRQKMQDLAVDRNIRCIVIRGAGDQAFAAGGDL
ncbi:MAG: enoyl-CoA hydratase/isomerase family protein, partial [Azonexus sp.]|nr:enoyl-CoA hydratase/isomerase family protein [Azonexus sp.]